MKAKGRTFAPGKYMRRFFLFFVLIFNDGYCLSNQSNQRHTFSAALAIFS